MNRDHAGRRPSWRLLTVAVGLLALPACDVESIVEMRNPDLITPEVVADTANLPTLANGVSYEFARAYGGQASNASTAGPGQIHLSGLLADEFWHASTFSTFDEIDARSIVDTNSNVLIAYRYLQRARNLAEQSAQLFGESPRANTGLHARMLNLAGYSYVLFAENFCSGVPFSTTSFGGEVEYGEQITTTQTLQRAITTLDQALEVATAAGDAEMVNLARVGRARALQNLGQFSEAAAAASAVPTDFVFNLEFGPPPQPNNAVWFFTNSASRISVATNEGQNGLEFFERGDEENKIDPRMPVDSAGYGLGNPNTPQYIQGVYPTQASPLPLATGIEARLIEAEADLAGGASGAYLTTLNELRLAADLLPVVDPVGADERVEQFYNERARWLWLTSHRLGDLRRMMREYGFSADEIFPIGTAIQGEPYGDDVSLPVPFDERNNPLFTGSCLAAE